MVFNYTMNIVWACLDRPFKKKKKEKKERNSKVEDWNL